MNNTETCWIPLLEREQAFEQIQKTYDVEQNSLGQVLNRTKVVANSRMAWQTTSRALQIYLALQKVDKRLRDLLCLYTSVLNGCVYCIDDAAGEALLNGWSLAELRGLKGKLSDTFSPSIAAALEYAEHLTFMRGVADATLQQKLREHYDTEAILEITAIISMKNFWNRFASGLGIPSERHCADQDLVRELAAVHADKAGN